MKAALWIRYLLALPPVSVVHEISNDLEEGGGSRPNKCFNRVVPESVSKTEKGEEIHCYVCY